MAKDYDWTKANWWDYPEDDDVEVKEIEVDVSDLMLPKEYAYGGGVGTLFEPTPTYHQYHDMTAPITYGTMMDQRRGFSNGGDGEGRTLGDIIDHGYFMRDERLAGPDDGSYDIDNIIKRFSKGIELSEPMSDEDRGDVSSIEEIFERDTPLTEGIFGLSEGFTLSPLTLIRRYLAKKELEKNNKKNGGRINYANGGVYKGGGADYIGLNPRNAPIQVEDLTVEDDNGNFLISAANALENQDGIIGAATDIMSPGVKTIEGSLINDDYPNDRIRSMVTTPGRFSEFDKARMGSPANINAWGYEDLIMNPENNPNALNWQRIENNIMNQKEDFIPGFDFIDAPNKVSNLKEAWQNRNYLDNPRTGWWDSGIMSKGNPDKSLANRTKNKLGDIFSGAKRGMKNLGGKFKEGAGIIMGPVSALASMRNPLNPNAANYNPNLAGQLNALNNMTGTVTSGTTTGMSKDDIAAGNFKTKSGAMLVTDPGTGLTKYGPGSVLAGQNAISGFGTNDYVGQLEKELEKMEKRAAKKDLTPFQLRRQQDIIKELDKANEIAKSNADKKAADALAAELAAAAASKAESARQYDPNVHGPNNYGLGSDGQQSYDSGQGFGINATTGGPVSNKTGRGRTDWADGGIISLKR